MVEVYTDNISGQYSIMDYFLIELILHEVLFCFANNIWYINKRIKRNYWNIIPGSILWLQMVTKLFCTFGPTKVIATRSKTIFWTSFKFFGLIILNKSSTRNDNWSSISSINQFVMLRDKKLVWEGVFSFLYILIKSRNRYEHLCMCICNCLFQLTTYWKFLCMLIYYYCLNIV